MNHTTPNALTSVIVNPTIPQVNTWCTGYRRPQESKALDIDEPAGMFSRQAGELEYFKKKLSGVGAAAAVLVGGMAFRVCRTLDGFHLIKGRYRPDPDKPAEYKDLSEATIAQIEKRLAKESGHKLDEPGCVYLVSDGEFTKIGATSYAVSKRLNELQVGNAKPLTLIGWYEVQNKISTEAHLHDRYKSKNVRGEWFNLTQMDVYEILSSRLDVINRDRFFKLTAADEESLLDAAKIASAHFTQMHRKLYDRLLRNMAHTPGETCELAGLRRQVVANSVKAFA